MSATGTTSSPWPARGTRQGRPVAAWCSLPLPLPPGRLFRGRGHVLAVRVGLHGGPAVILLRKQNAGNAFCGPALRSASSAACPLAGLTVVSPEPLPAPE